MRAELKSLLFAGLSILFTNAHAAPAPAAVPAGTPVPISGTGTVLTAAPAAAPATAKPAPAPAAQVNSDGSIPMPASAGVLGGAPTPVEHAEPVVIKPTSNHGYVIAQGTINQPYGANPYRTLTVTVEPCDTGYTPYISMGVGGIAGWASHTVAEAWAVPTSMIKRDGNTYTVNYRAESRFYNGSWAWSSNVFLTWSMYCIPTDSFTYSPH